jgi:hypothetical protein
MVRSLSRQSLDREQVGGKAQILIMSWPDLRVPMQQWRPGSLDAALMHADQPNLSPTQLPVCPDCLTIMRFVTAELDKTDPNLRHAIFVCDCGRALGRVLAQADLRALKKRRWNERQ